MNEPKPAKKNRSLIPSQVLKMRLVMKRLILALMVGSWGVLAHANDICVLALFAKGSPEDRIVRDVFANYAPATVFANANFDDIDRCLSGSYSELLWISHGTLAPNGLAFPVMDMMNASGHHVAQPLYTRYFDKLQQQLATMNTRLKRVRVATCGVAIDTNNAMTPFLTALTRNGVEIDIAPRSEWASALLDRSVTPLSREWLSLSINRWSLRTWATPDNAWCERDFWPGCDRGRARYVLPRSAR